jgi:serpin B
MRNFDEFKEELLRRKTQQKAKDRRKRRLIGCVCTMLCLAILAGLVMRPTTQVQALNLMDGIRAQNVQGKNPDDRFRRVQYEFALELLKACRGMNEEGNTLVSPLSVMLALSMTANGAEGETLRQFEEVLGLPVEELNEYLKNYVNQLQSNWLTKVHIANSIWFREGLAVKQDFLQTNANYYGAGAYASPFDAQTLKDINTWVSENTDGMIDNILDEIEPAAVMYLVNALCFDAKWKRGLFDQSKTITGGFYEADGTVRKVTKMES